MGSALSDEAIHALVDGEYSPEDRLEALEAIAADPALGHEVCELHRLKALVRTAYDDLTPPERPASETGAAACGLRDHRGQVPFRWASSRGQRNKVQDTQPRAFGIAGVARAVRHPLDADAHGQRPGLSPNGWARYFGSACARYAAAAAITGAVTAVIATATIGGSFESSGTSTHAVQNAGPDAVLNDQSAVATTGGELVVPAVPSRPMNADRRDGSSVPVVAKAFDAPITADTQQILLHLTEADTSVMADLLADVERLLREGERLGQDLRVQVVTNAGGLNLLRADRSPFAERIATLQASYPQLRFAACESTIDDHQRAEGQRPALLPNVVSIDSGVAEVARRQREGWVYIRV